MDRAKMKEVFNIAAEWARVNVPDTFNYNSRASYCQSAVAAGIITKEDWNNLSEYFGDMWWYVGD